MVNLKSIIQIGFFSSAIFLNSCIVSNALVAPLLFEIPESKKSSTF